MRKYNKLPFKLLLAMMLVIVLTISVGLSIWLITDRIEIKPELDANKVITQYLDNLSEDYQKDIVFLPSNKALGLDKDSEDLTYYYRLIKDSEGNDVSNLEENKEYSIVEGKNGPMNAGTYEIIVKYLVLEDSNPDDDIDDSIVVISDAITFVINKAEIDMSGILFIGEELTYDKKQHNITISGSLPKDKNDNTVITDVVYTCNNEAFNGATNAGTYNITASFVYDEANYETIAPKNATLKINPKSISLSTWEFDGNSNNTFDYTGSEIETISSSLVITDDDEKPLTVGTDYTVNFSDIVNLGTSHKFTVTGKGNYTGIISGTYIIRLKPTNLVITPTKLNEDQIEIVTYNGNAQFPSFDITVGDSVIDDAEVTYKIISLFSNEVVDEMKNQGNYNVTVTASKEGYVSTSEIITVTILPINLVFVWSDDNFIYDKQEHNPTLSVSGIIDGDAYPLVLTEGQTNAGKYIAKAVSINENYVTPNNDEQPFEISPRTIELKNLTQEISFDNDVRNWDSIKFASLQKLEFRDNDVLGNDKLNLSISGMHNGVYVYGNLGSDSGVNISDMDTTSNVVGSTYQVFITINNNNYNLKYNYFVLKYKTAIVDGAYYTIEDAIFTAKTKGIISMVGNSSKVDSHVITCFSLIDKGLGDLNNYKTLYELNNKTLLVPYNSSTNEKDATSGNPESGNVYSALVIPKGITINAISNSNIIAGAQIGYRQNITATIAGNRGVLVNNGAINIGSGDTSDKSCIKAYGYIKGEGEIVINKNSTGIEGMSIYDFAGGKRALAVMSEVIPMNSWSVHNNSCSTKIMSGAYYKGFVFLDILDAVTSEVTAVGVTSEDKCIFLPSEISDRTYVYKKAALADTWIEDTTTKYETQRLSLSSISGNNQTKGQKDIFEIYGKYTDATFSINVSPASLSTKLNQSQPCPLSYQHVVIKNGATFTLKSSDYLFLPGTSLEIEENATVNINKDVNVTIATLDDFANITGGFVDKNHCIDKKDSVLFVNGTLNVNGKIGGKIDSSSPGAVLTFGNNAEFQTSARTYCLNDVPTLTPLTSVDFKETESVLAKNTAFISEVKDDGTTYWWKKADSVQYIQIILYDSDGQTEMDRIIIQLVNSSSTYILSNDMFEWSKKHYEFIKWINVSDQSEFISTTMTASELTEDGEVPESSTLKLQAEWKIIEYDFEYLTSYGYLDEENEIINYLSEEDGVKFTNINSKFTIETLNSGDINISTLASYSVGESQKYMDGWYIGYDKSTGIRITSLSKEKFEKLLSILTEDNKLLLYCEFTDEVHHNIIITNSGNETINDLSLMIGFSIGNGKSISDYENYSLEIDTSSYDNSPTYEYFFNGFIDENGDEYTLEQLEELEIKSDMRFKLKWSKKFALEYDDGVTHFYKPGTIVDLKDTSNKSVYASKSNGDYYVKCDFSHWEINANKVTNYTVPDEIGGKITLVSKYVENESIKYYKVTIDRGYADFSISVVSGNDSILLDDTFKLSSSYKSTDFDIDNHTIYVKNGEKINIRISLDNSILAPIIGTQYIDEIIINGSVTDDLNGKNKETHDKNGVEISGVTSVKITTYKDGGTCIAEGTLITLADGTKRAVEDLRKGDLVMAFDHLTGKVTFNKVIIVVKTQSYYFKNTFVFDDGTELVTINEHGIYDLDLNMYVNIDHLNYHDYLGHRFVSIDVNGNVDSKVLVDVKSIYESGYKYDIVTNETLNYVAEDTLSVTHVLVDIINTFEFDQNMKYDQEKMMEDINKYGLYEYDEWSEYCDIKVFEEYNIPIMKVGVSKGLYTKEYIISLINTYVLDDSVQIISE